VALEKVGGDVEVNVLQPLAPSLPPSRAPSLARSAKGANENVALYEDPNPNPDGGGDVDVDADEMWNRGGTADRGIRSNQAGDKASPTTANMRKRNGRTTLKQWLW
jgi:hypothetical protein